jgi:hypothetical protein
MKPHYFAQESADENDRLLGVAKLQGYVPPGCLLGGMVVMGEVVNGRNPCRGCNGPRERCGGQPKRDLGPPMSDDARWTGNQRADGVEVRPMLNDAYEIIRPGSPAVDRCRCCGAIMLTERRRRTMRFAGNRRTKVTRFTLEIRLGRWTIRLTLIVR